MHRSPKERTIIAAQQRSPGISPHEAHSAEASDDFGALGEPDLKRIKPKGDGPHHRK
ncbi:hypothetical protein [Gorillibacterium timonense]|uniref:hypothetical protein n=1 Tax=Gorillibacterium timonense TaxID=1689269 RepID=UPI00131CB353|nr:hypothetical protein [Gorillibacterium timonense]